MKALAESLFPSIKWYVQYLTTQYRQPQTYLTTQFHMLNKVQCKYNNESLKKRDSFLSHTYSGGGDYNNSRTSCITENQ